MTSKYSNEHHILPVDPDGSTLEIEITRDERNSISPLCSDYPEFMSGMNKEIQAVTRPAEAGTGIITNWR